MAGLRFNEVDERTPIAAGRASAANPSTERVMPDPYRGTPLVATLIPIDFGISSVTFSPLATGFESTIFTVTPVLSGRDSYSTTP